MKKIKVIAFTSIFSPFLAIVAIIFAIARGDIRTSFCPIAVCSTIWGNEENKSNKKAVEQTAIGQKDVRISPLAIANVSYESCFPFNVWLSNVKKSAPFLYTIFSTAFTSINKSNKKAVEQTAIGQKDVRISPLAIANMMATIASFSTAFTSIFSPFLAIVAIIFAIARGDIRTSFCPTVFHTPHFEQMPEEKGTTIWGNEENKSNKKAVEQTAIQQLSLPSFLHSSQSSPSYLQLLEVIYVHLSVQSLI
jgi:hypothetical protein